MISRAIWQRVDQSAGPDACWPWQGYCDRHGYGRIELSRIPRRTLAVHVAIWEMLHGPKPVGRELHHTCHTPACVNPAHLVLVTHRENMLAPGGTNWAYVHSQRTHCPQGHPIDGLRSDGRRYCRPCSVENVRRY